jgi:ABC-2 type transport system permease protein
MYPLDNIPTAIKWIPYLNPLKYFTVLVRNIMLKGGDPAVVWPNLGAMALLAAVMIAVSFRRFSRTLN